MLFIVDTGKWTLAQVHELSVKMGIPAKHAAVMRQKLASKLLKQYLCREFGASKIAITSEGRPYFVDSNADFSISHHEDIVVAVAATHTKVKLGIDVTDLELNSFAPQELQELFGGIPANCHEAAKWWAAREAYIKSTSSSKSIKVESTSEGISVNGLPVHIFTLGCYICAAIAPEDALLDHCNLDWDQLV